MEYAHPEALVGVEWLSQHYQDPDIRIVDATYHLPISDRDAAEEYGFRHIPGAIYFDVDTVCDKDSPLPHMIPTAEAFAAAVGKMGIGNQHHVIVYDGSGGFLAAARVWWMFRLFGHDKVSMLDGGLAQWGKKRHPLDKKKPKHKPEKFVATFRPELLRTVDQMSANLKSGADLVLDARSAGRFNALEWEPRECKRFGHIPGSINMPFPELMVQRKDYMMRPAAEIAAAFQKAGVDFTKPTVATCGSGLTACVLAFGAYLMGHKDMAVYDGSWAEWAERADLPLEDGGNHPSGAGTIPATEA